jgi:anti-anti-sigma regulatory factor
MGGVNTVDYSAMMTLKQLFAELHRHDIRIAFIGVSDDLKDDVARYGLGEHAASSVFTDLDEAIGNLARTSP